MTGGLYDLVEGVEEGLRLVYEPGDYPRFINGETGRSLYPDHEGAPLLKIPVTLPAVGPSLEQKPEEVVGVDLGVYHRIREVDMGDAVGIVWDRRDREIPAEVVKT